ncbi:MAG TPA: electron transport complex subunit E [Firmicutes bacterium]|jgi:electron transport complex protein RnfE|nr:electron transport complex subunit E [Bacillota bacterium]
MRPLGCRKGELLVLKQLRKDFMEGFAEQTPPFFTAMGLCPALAVTTGVLFGFTMGLAVIFVLVGSNIVISLLRKWVPHEVRIPVYTVIIATLVTIADLVLAGTVPAIHKTLGLFIPLIVVNCIILGRAEAFASKNNVLRSTVDGLGYGLGFTWALIVISAIRELLGAGTLADIRILPEGFVPWQIMLTPPGAFITMGFITALITLGRNRAAAKKSEKEKLATTAQVA